MRVRALSSQPRLWLVALLAALLLLALAAGVASAQNPTPAAGAPAVAPTGSLSPTVGSGAPATVIPNDTCLTCHRQHDLQMTLPSGQALPVTVDETLLQSSVHRGLQCQQCHTDIAGYPHGNLPVDSHRDLEIHYSQSCANCHEHQALEQVDSVHAQVRAAGINEAAVCADCHGSHNIQPISRAKHPEVSAGASAAMCEQCHSGIHDKFKNSVHGQALTAGNPDVPTCIDCHPAHTAEDPRTLDFRLKSPEMCGSCHADKALMAKYGLSTQVFDTYVADFHGKTVMLFDETAPGQPTNKAVCTDCHGVHDIQSATAENSVMKTNLVQRCQECHPDATTNFADSWLGHYTPDWTRFPLVAFVDLFYRILIPTVVAFFVIYVAIDAYRRLRNRRAKRRAASV